MPQYNTTPSRLEVRFRTVSLFRKESWIRNISLSLSAIHCECFSSVNLILHITVLFISPEIMTQLNVVKLTVPSIPGKTEPLGGSKSLEVAKPEHQASNISLVIKL